MVQAVERGELKAIWIAATNPMVSLPDVHQVRRAFEKAELVIVNDAYHPTETSRLADIVFPVAQWGEKSWTSTNSERMVSFSPKLWEPPGEAIPDWEILARFARKMGFSGFDYTCQSEVWDEFIRLTKGRPCDMSGMNHARLQDASMQWPCPDSYHYGTKRLYLDHQFPTPDGRANFLPRDHRDPQELPDADFPFILTTGRIYGHWHTLTRTGKVEKLNLRDPKPYIEIHPSDAQKIDVQEDELVRLSTRRGEIQLPARIKDTISPGTVFVPFHWGDLFGEGNALNYLTIQAIGRVAKQPELKFCSVQLSKISPSAASAETVHENIFLPQSIEELSCN
jgi:ferredoxin-nitrate reductase